MDLSQPSRLNSQAAPNKRPGSSVDPPTSSRHEVSRAGNILMLQSRALSHDKFVAAATAAVTDLALLLKCERVSLGLLENQRVQVATVSGVSDLRKKQNAVQVLANAMHEALNQHSEISYPQLQKSSANTALAHAKLALRNGGLSIYTLPVYSDGQAVAALLFERRQGFDAPALELAKDAALFVGPLLVLKKRAESSLSVRIKAAVGLGPSGFTPSLRGFAALAALCSLLLLGAWPTTYRVVASARVEGKAQRVISAPVDGFIRSVAIRPGEAVQANQVILQLDDQDLVLEREKWESEIAKLDKQYRDALSKSEAAAIVIAASKLDEARSQLALARRQTARTALKAPFDGVLISGDLSQSIGMPVKRGQELMTMATERSYRIVVEVDEQDVADLKLGQTAYALFATLKRPVPFQVARISPVANTAEGRNVFEVEGHGDAGAATLRHGLRGVAKIEIEPSFTAAVWWHRASQWLRRTLWRLTG